MLATACGAPPARTGYVTGADGTRFYYRVLGSAPDTIVAIHGGPGAGMGALLPHVEPLAAHHTILLYDQRGGGRSDLPQDTTLLDAGHHIADLETLRRHFRIEQMNVIAHSFGAVGPRRRAAAAAARAPALEADSATRERLIAVLHDLLRGTAADPVASCREYEALSRELALARGDTSAWRGTTCDAPPEAVAYYYRYTARLSPCPSAIGTTARHSVPWRRRYS